MIIAAILMCLLLPMMVGMLGWLIWLCFGILFRGK